MGISKKFQRSSGSSGFTPEQLEQIVSASGLPPLKEKKPLNILDKISRIVNFGTATVAGATRGAIRKDLSVGEGIAQGVQKNIGFGDVMREDLGIKPESRLGKVGMGAAGFLADVVFDPLTYLSFGTSAGLKVGGKTLTKTGTKLAQASAREIVEKNVAKALAKGMAPEVAQRLGGQKVSGFVNELMQRSFGAKGLTEEATEQFLKEGVSEQTLYTLRELGPKLLDQGGVKWFGKTLVTSKQLAKTPVGKAARRLGETEVGKAVGRLGEALGKTFVPDFMKNPKLVSIIDRAKTTQRRSINGILEANKVLFQDLDNDQMSKLFDNIWEMKRNIIGSSDEIQKETIDNLNKMFPELKVKSAEHAKNLLNGLEDRTLEGVSKIRADIDEIIKPYFEKRKDLIEGGALGGTKAGLQKTPASKSFGMVDELNGMVKQLKDKLKEIRSSRPRVPVQKRMVDLGGEITDDEMIHVGNRLIGYEEERLAKVVDDIEKQIANASKAGPVKVGKAGEKLVKLTPQEQIVLAERKIVSMQKDFSEQEKMLQKVLGARQEAKKRQAGVRLIFKGDEKLQAVSDALFEGKDSIIKKFANAAGLSEDDAIKFYIPSKFKDKVTVNDFSWGRNMGSPKMGFLKQFTGAEDNLIRDPFEAYSRGQVDVVTARIKTDAFKSTLKSLGRPIADITEEAAKARGLVKVGRETLEGKIEGWFPKEVAEEINKFLDPKKIGTIDELARVTGFDYVTGIFKGYVTSLFPGFHVRNITSNQFQNILKIGMDTGNPVLQKNALEIALGKNLDNVFHTKTGKTLTNRQIRDMVQKESDILEKFSSKYGSMEQMLTEANPKNMERLGNFNMFNPSTWQNVNPFSRDNIALKTGRNIGGFAEAQAKMVSVLQALNEGKGVKEGIKQAEEAIFNYGKLTDMERDIFRRIIPFYTFARKNAEFQIRMLATNPGRVAGELKAIRNAGQAFGEPITEEDTAGLPNWIIDSLGIKAGANKYGQQQFITGFGLPIEEFIQRFSGDKGIAWNFTKNMLSQFNPILKFPIERATGTDIFRGRPITEIDNGQDLKAFLDVMPKAVGDEFKALIQFKEIPNQPVYVDGKIVDRKSKYVANPFVLHWIRNLPTSRISSTVGYLTDDTSTIDQQLLKFFTGIKGFSIDQENQEYYKELTRSRELIDYLERMGVMKSKEINYIPK